MEATGRWVSAVLHAQGIQNQKGDIMNDDDDYNMIDEIMHLVTIIFLVLITITFLAVVTGFIWGML